MNNSESHTNVLFQYLLAFVNNKKYSRFVGDITNEGVKNEFLTPWERGLCLYDPVLLQQSDEKKERDEI